MTLGSAITHRQAPLIAILGPTAVGKTAFSLALAQWFDAEIVSADSRQVYRYMDIGTAKATAAERSLAPHHLIDVVDPDQVFSLADYQDLAVEAVAQIHGRGRPVLLVGGTGLYLRAVLEGYSLPRLAPNPALRRQLEQVVDSEGVEALFRQLQERAPEVAAEIDRYNPRRLIRALELLEAGRERRPSEAAKALPAFRSLRIGLTMPRTELYDRIDDRVDRQMSDGWLAEVESLLARGYGPELSSMSGIGYRQLSAHLHGELGLEEAVQQIKYRTHRFVRQQYTWFRLDDPAINWFEAGKHTAEPMFDLVERFLKGAV